ncbi:hypothetical protein PHYBOEH_006345 [Phytophthora boehmeriae]|uniref:BRCT domain-containing protein n=1 Tax=Phytophthora boehmeriae TaxID=109152 RepID=A0A8T1WJ99_9STRA|nr:hypothetical protein PHYBOEH_006345 [Phytophthora boehmeriae]
MRQRSLYAALRCVVHPAELEMAELLALELCLRDGGATLLDDVRAAGGNAVTHIVCHPKAYKTFSEQRNERFVALVRPEWVFRTFLLQKLLPVDRFTPNPAMFFSTLAISAGPIAKDPRKVINGLITHFGGQIVDQKEVYGGATHILSPDEASEDAETIEKQEFREMLQLSFTKGDVARSVEAWRVHLTEQPNGSTFTLPSCLGAYMGQRAGLSTQHHVKYAWIEECVRRQSRVPEGPFVCNGSGKSTTKTRSWKTQPEFHLEDMNISKCAQVYQLGRSELSTELSVVRTLSDEKLTAMKETMTGAIVLLAQHIAPLLRETVSDVLKSVDAKVANVPFGESYQDIVGKVVTNAAFVVCRYRGGFEYDEAVRQKKRVVSIYWVLAGLTLVKKPSLFNEAIQRPVKSFGGVPEMQYFVITLSGYTSRTSPTREELQIAIHATGACMLPVLSRTHSTHLLCHEASGEKYKKALSWRFENILSHEWIFECLSKWDHVAENAFRYNSPKGKHAEDESTTSKGSAKKVKSGEEVINKTEAAITPSSKSAKKAAKSTQGRFDVDDILTEIDKVPTPSDKKSPGNLKATTPAASVGKSTSTPDRAKDVTCTLFDTPTNDSASTTSSKRRSRSRKTQKDEPMPLEEASAEEVEIEPAAEDSKAVKVPVEEPPLVISISSDSNANESGTLEEASTSPVSRASVRETKPAKKVAANKRKGTDSKEEEDAAVQSTSKPSKRQKKAAAASETSPEPSPPKSEPLFLLTGTREQAEVYGPIITSLGGRVSQIGRKFDTECTHIICFELKRTEKFIAGCAAGKWILKPSYLEACSVAGKFVEEADYEWGTDASDKELMDPRIWPEAPAYWRKELSAGKPGAFSGWRFFIHSKCVPPRDMCERIAVAGGGSVVPLIKSTDMATLSKESTAEAPVVALLPPDLSARDTWLKKLKTHNIECIKANFIIDYITKEQKPPVERADYQI